LLYEKATEKSCGDSCVEWAVEKLIEGRDGVNLCRLAAMLPPHNHFEVAELRDRALAELDVRPLDRDKAILSYANEIISQIASGDADEFVAAAMLANLYLEAFYNVRELRDFYFLYNAALDLDYDEIQWYWNGATRQNIRQLIRDRASDAISGNPNSEVAS
jgi:hypothetical protein